MITDIAQRLNSNHKAQSSKLKVQSSKFKTQRVRISKDKQFKDKKGFR